MPLEGTYVSSPVPWVRDQVELFERSQGTEGNTLRGMPVIILTTKGVRSGHVRKTPLMKVEHDGHYAAVASQGGAPTHPVWYFNLVANSAVELQDGSSRWDMVAREVQGEERAVWWDRAVEAFPDYAGYQEKTDRRIPIVVIEHRPA